MHTLVPLFRPVMSSVIPAGTVMPFRVMVVQLALDWMAVTASVKVQLPAGAATGLARLRGVRAPRASSRAEGATTVHMMGAVRRRWTGLWLQERERRELAGGPGCRGRLWPGPTGVGRLLIPTGAACGGRWGRDRGRGRGRWVLRLLSAACRRQAPRRHLSQPGSQQTGRRKIEVLVALLGLMSIGRS